MGNPFRELDGEGKRRRLTATAHGAEGDISGKLSLGLGLVKYLEAAGRFFSGNPPRSRASLGRDGGEHETVPPPGTEEVNRPYNENVVPWPARLRRGQTGH